MRTSSYQTPVAVLSRRLSSQTAAQGLSSFRLATVPLGCRDKHPSTGSGSQSRLSPLSDARTQVGARRVAGDRWRSNQWVGRVRQEAFSERIHQSVQKECPARPQRVRGRGIPSGYVEGPNDARTKLTVFFNRLKRSGEPTRRTPQPTHAASASRRFWVVPIQSTASPHCCVRGAAASPIGGTAAPHIKLVRGDRDNW